MSRSTRRLLLACTALVAVSLAMHAEATTTTASIGVTATVVSLCAVSALPIAFGNYSPDNGATAQTSVSVACTTGTPYTVGLDNGSTAGATTAARLLSAGAGQTLAYTLYQDAGYSTVWGNSTGTNTKAGTGSGLAQTLTVYGKVASGQNASTGIYTDTVTVTLTY